MEDVPTRGSKEKVPPDLLESESTESINKSHNTKKQVEKPPIKRLKNAKFSLIFIIHLYNGSKLMRTANG